MRSVLEETGVRRTSESREQLLRGARAIQVQAGELSVGASPPLRDRRVKERLAVDDHSAVFPVLRLPVLCSAARSPFLERPVPAWRASFMRFSCRYIVYARRVNAAGPGEGGSRDGGAPKITAATELQTRKFPERRGCALPILGSNRPPQMWDALIVTAEPVESITAQFPGFDFFPRLVLWYGMGFRRLWGKRRLFYDSTNFLRGTAQSGSFDGTAVSG